MTIPWNDEVTASIEVDGDRRIITEGKLYTVIPLLAARSREECSRIILAFPDRCSPPYRYNGWDIGALAAALERNGGHEVHASSRASN